MKRNQKISTLRYQIYVFISLGLLGLYPLVKTLLDANILLTTGRVVGADDWLNLTIAKKEKIALDSQPDRKRILIVAGSNGLFGISAEKIAQKTGIETINLSSHAGLGGEYILNRAVKIIRKGDIILLPIEYPFYYSSGISDDFQEKTLNTFMISYDRESLYKISPMALLRFSLNNVFKDLSSPEYRSYFDGHLSKKDISDRLHQQRDRVENNCYSGLTLNKFGDETCNIGREKLPVNPRILEPVCDQPDRDKVDPNGYIKKFADFSERIGAKIIPLYPITTYTKYSDTIGFKNCAEEVKKFWENQGIKFYDALEDSLLSPSLMLDTPYHAKDAGRQKRTKKIIDLIKQNIGVI